MQPLAHYMSHTLDPYSDDAVEDQSDINKRWSLQYKCDSIVSSLGSQQLSINVDIFLSDIENELDEDAISAFYQVLFKKITEIYHMDCLEDHCDNNRSFDYNKEVKKLLLFLSKDSFNFLIELLRVIFDINIPINEQYIKVNFSKLETQLLKLSTGIPYLAQYFFYYDTLDNRCFALDLMLKRDYYHLLSKLV